MKVTRKELPATFTPVTLEITIESESELRTLYTLIANISSQYVLTLSEGREYEVSNIEDTTSLMGIYYVLKEICKEKL